MMTEAALCPPHCTIRHKTRRNTIIRASLPADKRGVTKERIQQHSQFLLGGGGIFMLTPLDGVTTRRAQGAVICL